MHRRNLVLAYILFVGVPAVGLLAIVRAGQRLTPPISVGGAWNVNANFNSLGSAACAELLNGIKQPFFTISQSGGDLVFTLNDTGKSAVAGTLQGATLAMGTDQPGASASASGGCGDPQNVYLSGMISKQGDQRELTGTLGVSDCAQCVAIPFRAVRQAAEAGGAR
jgi:hypothetical protein